MKLFWRYKIHHILFWLLYFVCWTFFSVRFNHVSVETAFLVTAAWFVGQAGTFYACIYFLVPRFLNKKRYGIFSLCISAIVLLTSIFTAACTVGLLTPVTAFNIPLSTFSVYVLIDNYLIVIVTVAVRVINDRIKSEQRNQLLEKEKTENELRFLRSQINPHFLFNAINSIYVLIKKDPDFAAVTLAKFADMLRYQLYECNADEIPIENEIAYLNNYIELEKLRKGNTVVVNYTIDESSKNIAVAPLLLIPFVENAFKYVSAFAAKPNVVTIAIKYHNKVFTLLAENTTDENNLVKEEKSFSGIGLENVKRRLELIYPNRHTLEIENANEKYSVLLNIQIP